MSFNITVAKTAGFCFGVDRAVKTVYDSLEKYENVSTLGPIIHNPNVVEDLKSQGVGIINSPDEAKENMTVVIRSHGVGKSVYDELSQRGCEIVDATCPFVSRIHKIAYDKSKEGYVVLIAGDETHPEVQGIRGFCQDLSFVFSNVSELEEILKNISINLKKKVAILCQTTYNIKIWDECKRKIKELIPDALVFDTICNATNERQAECEKLSKENDLMIIVGGRQSSNTLKLKGVCEKFCKCYLVENSSELYDLDFKGYKKIGISAGASTPAYIIKEVQVTMSEILKNLDEEFNFEEALEQTFKKVYTGKKVKGYITSVNNGEVIVDIGTKHTGYIPMSELSEDSSVKPADILKVGDEVDVMVLKINDQEGIVTLSKKRVDAIVGFENILKAKEEGTVLSGVVTNVIKGGVLVAYNGIKVFVPASQATMRKDDKLEELLKKNVNFKILDVNEARQRAVGSIRAVAKEEKAAMEAKFYETAEVGATVVGEVKSITDYGVFVDLGGVDGLIRKPDLSWARIKHPSEVVKVGEKVEVTIKDIDKENGKVSLVYKKTEDNPWTVFANNYELGQVVDATVVSITSFGAFAQIIPEIDGLIHISQIANQRVNNVADMLKVGDVVKAKITEIDLEKKRVSLSMRALIEETEEVAEEVTEEDAE